MTCVSRQPSTLDLAGNDPREVQDHIGPEPGLGARALGVTGDNLLMRAGTGSATGPECADQADQSGCVAEILTSARACLVLDLRDRRWVATPLKPSELDSVASYPEGSGDRLGASRRRRLGAADALPGDADPPGSRPCFSPGPGESGSGRPAGR